MRILPMPILVCAATERELSPLLSRLPSFPWQDAIRVLITGVGLTASVYALTREVIIRRPAFILQAGLGGSLDDGLPLGRVVAIQSEAIGDEGVMEEGTFASLHSLGWKNEGPIWKGEKLQNPCLPSLPISHLPLVHGVTVNEISTAPDRIRYYRTSLEASVESMEGAALHYVALNENVPFLQLRSLSNKIGERDKKNWAVQEAVSQLNAELELLIPKLLFK